MKKPVMACAALLALIAFLAGCGGSGSEPQRNQSEAGESADGQAAETRTFTLEELAGFDGREGRPAYVAVDGTVYDLSGSSSWPEGDHTPCSLDVMAGRDLSEEIE